MKLSDTGGTGLPLSSQTIIDLIIGGVSYIFKKGT